MTTSAGKQWFARAALGDLGALHRLIARHADRNADVWERLAAVRTLLLHPAQRMSDVVGTVADIMRWAHDDAQMLAEIVLPWMHGDHGFRAHAPPSVMQRIVMRLLARWPAAAAHVLVAGTKRQRPGAHHTAWNKRTRAALVRFAAGDPHAACAVVESLAPLDGALTAAWQQTLARAIACNRDAISHIITRLAPHWRRLDADARHTLLEAAAKDLSAACHAIIALMPPHPRSDADHEHGALTLEQQCMLVRAVADHPWMSTDVIARIAAQWTELPASVQNDLIRAAARNETVAYRFLVALLPRAGALVRDHRMPLIATIARNPRSSAALIADLARCWLCLDADIRATLVRAAAARADAAHHALSVLTPITDALSPTQRRMLLRSVVRSASAAAAFMGAIADQWETCAPAWRDRALRAVAQQPASASQALGALAPSGALTECQQHALAHSIARNAQCSAAAIASLAPHWNRIATHVQCILLHAAAQDASAAQRALTALLSWHASPAPAPHPHPDFPCGDDGACGGAADALAPDWQRILIEPCTRNADALASAITAIAPHWTRLDRSVRAIVLQAATHDAHAAHHVFAALAPIHGALHADHARMLVHQIARSPEASAACIECIARHWQSVDEESRTALLSAATACARAASRALAALALHAVAVSDAQQRALAASIARCPDASADLIRQVASHWGRLGDDVQQRLLRAVARAEETACAALHALLPHPGALTPTQQHMLASAIADRPSACARLIADVAPHWTSLDADVRMMLLRTAARKPEPAQYALRALLPLADALAPNQQHMLVHAIGPTIVFNPEFIALAITHWHRLAAEVRRTLADAAAPHDSEARSMLAALLAQHVDPDGASACTLAQAPTMTLARAVFPAAPWHALVSDSAERAIALGVVVRHVVAYALKTPRAQEGRHALRDAWHALTPSDHRALARVCASYHSLAIALGLVAADHHVALDSDARRILARAILPPEEALTALQHAPDASVIDAWRPLDPPCDEERDLWRRMLHEGSLPMSIVAALVHLIADSPPTSHRRTRRA